MGLPEVNNRLGKIKTFSNAINLINILKNNRKHQNIVDQCFSKSSKYGSINFIIILRIIHTITSLRARTSTKVTIYNKKRRARLVHSRKSLSAILGKNNITKGLATVMLIKKAKVAIKKNRNHIQRVESLVDGSLALVTIVLNFSVI